MKLLLRWILASGALLLTVWIVDGVSLIGGPLYALPAVLALALVNLLARPIVFLLRAITLPLSCLTFGLWTFLLSLFANVLVFYFVGTMRWGLHVDSFGAALMGAVLMSVLNTVLTGLFEIGRRAAQR